MPSSSSSRDTRSSGSRWAGTPRPALHPLDAREQLHAAAVGFVEELARERPAVVLVRGHPLGGGRPPRPARADRARSASSGRRARDGSSGAPRPPSDVGRRPAERDDDLARSARGGDASRLVEGLLDLELPGELRQLLVERSEGNPFFVEELVGELVDAGVLERRRRRLGGRRGPGGLLRAGQRPGGPRRPARPASGAREVRAPGRGGRRPGVLAGAGDAARSGSEPDFDLLEERDFVRRRAGRRSRASASTRSSTP